MSVRAKKLRFAAVLEDCNELLDRFAMKDTRNFDNFAEVWKEMTFSLIFCGRRTEEELIELCEEVLMAAKSCWMSPNTCDRRLLAMYLVYGVYMKQPCQAEAKFKITSEDMDEIIDFVSYIKEHDLQEHMAMFAKLMQLQAFSFCAVAFEMQLNNRAQRNDALELQMMICGEGTTQHTPSNMSKLVESGLFEKITLSEERYEEACSVLGREYSMTGDMEMKDLGRQLRNMCLRRTLVKTVEPETVKTKPKATPSSTGSHRRDIINRCYGNRNHNEDSSARYGDASYLQSSNKRKRRERGFYYFKKFKQHKDLVGAPLQGMYDNIHSMNSRTLYQKVLPKMRGARKSKDTAVGRDQQMREFLGKMKPLGAQYTEPNTSSAQSPASDM